MGLFHRATITPSKAEIVESWIRSAGIGASDSVIEAVGAFRFDDPEGEVGMETHLVRVDGVLVQVPLTYRAAPLAGAEASLISTTEHSAIGTRWVYDGLGDDCYLVMLVAVAMTGQGEALGMVHHGGRWIVAPANVRIEGGGWTTERVPVDQFTLVPGEEGTDQAGSAVTFRNETLELQFFRKPSFGERPPMGLAATWAGQSEPALLAQVQPTG